MLLFINTLSLPNERTSYSYRGSCILSVSIRPYLIRKALSHGRPSDKDLYLLSQA